MKRFLVAENDKVLRDLHGFFIKNRYKDADIDYASNGKEALAKALVNDYSVIISDIDMPSMDGISFYKMLKQDRPAAARKVVFLSDSHDNIYKSFLDKEGCPVLGKPFMKRHLYSLVERIFEMEDIKAAGERGSDYTRESVRIRTRLICNMVPPDNPPITFDSFEFIPAETIDHSNGGISVEYEGEKLETGSIITVYVEDLHIIKKVATVVWTRCVGGDIFMAGLRWAE